MNKSIPQLRLAGESDLGHQPANRTRQGYVRKRILKPAGHLFSGCAMKGGRP
jgi:hypothetical protein